MTKTLTYKFSKGEKLHIDKIAEIKALFGGDWWQFEELAGRGNFSAKGIEITRNIEITITAGEF